MVLGTLSGAGLSPDSVSYVSAARSLASGEGLRIWTGAPLVDWPPLYAMLLAAMSVTGLDAIAGARLAGVLAHGALVAVCGRWLVTRLRSKGVAWATIAALGAAPAVVWPALWAWSEPLFTLLCMSGLVLLDRCAASFRWSTLLWAAVLAGAAAVTRYAGVSLIGAGCVFLLWAGRARRGEALKRAVAFGAVASLPLLAWFLRNQAVTGTLMGDRAPSQWTVGFNVTRVFAFTSTWVLPVASDGGWLSAVWAALLLLIGAAVWFGVKAARSRGREGTPGESVDAAGGPGTGARGPENFARIPSGAGLMGLFLVAYLTMVIWSASTVALDVINHRLLAPAFPAFAVVVAIWADRALDAWGSRGPVLPRLLVGAFGLWFLLSLPATSESLGAGADGMGYRSPGWRSSEIVVYLQRGNLSGFVVSNDAPGVYLETGLPVEWGPRRHVYGSPQTVPGDITPLWERRTAGEPVTLVWFDLAPPYFMTAQDLDRVLPLRRLAAPGGGVVLAVE